LARSKRKIAVRINLYSKKKEEILLIVNGKIYKEKLHSIECRQLKEVNHLKWKPLLAVLLGLLMVGVTAGSASATAVVSKNQYTPIQLRVSPLSKTDKSKILSIVSDELPALGIPRTEISIENIQGYKASSYYAFTIHTPKGSIVGIYDGKSISLSRIIKTTENNIVVKTVTDGNAKIHRYTKSEIQELSQPFKRTTYYQPVSTAPFKGSIVHPDASFEHHWWGWKVVFTEQETQDIVSILEKGSATAGAIAAYLIYTGVPAGIALIAAAALMASATVIYTIDALGGHKGIYVEYVLGQIIIWHN